MMTAIRHGRGFRVRQDKPDRRSRAARECFTVAPPVQRQPPEFVAPGRVLRLSTSNEQGGARDQREQRGVPHQNGPQPPRSPRTDGDSGRGETMAFLVLAGVAVGSGLGYLVDRLAGTLPLFVVLGVFGGFVLALYAIYLETR